MEINDVEIINAQIISDMQITKHILAVYFVSKKTHQFYYYKTIMSNELFQDLNAGSQMVEEIVICNFKDCKEVSHQEIIERFDGDDAIKKYILAYIRDEKLNKLI